MLGESIFFRCECTVIGRAPVASRQLPPWTIPARNGVNGEGIFQSLCRHSGLILSWMSALAICDN
jgi:hypothetical protein